MVGLVLGDQQRSLYTTRRVKYRVLFGDVQLQARARRFVALLTDPHSPYNRIIQEWYERKLYRDPHL